MVTTGLVEREFREINQRTGIGARWTDEGAESRQASGGGETQWNEARILRADTLTGSGKATIL